MDDGALAHGTLGLAPSVGSGRSDGSDWAHYMLMIINFMKLFVYYRQHNLTSDQGVSYKHVRR